MDTRPVLSALIILAAVACGQSAPRVPAPVACGGGEPARRVDELELGPAGDGDDAFVPWSDNDVTSIVFGAQGGAMLGVRLRAHGLDGPCLLHETVLSASSGEPLTSSSVPLDTYAGPDGARTTWTLWLVMGDGQAAPGPGESVMIRAEAYDVAVARTLWIDHRP